MKNKKAYLVLADGTVFNGISMGKEGTALGEVVFNTCTASYGELLSDPTYYGQIVAQTLSSCRQQRRRKKRKRLQK